MKEINTTEGIMTLKKHMWYMWAMGFIDDKEMMRRRDDK